MSAQKLTQDRVRELFDYDSELGVLLWKKTTSTKHLLGKKAGGICNTHGYLIINIGGVFYRAHRLIWLFEYGYLPEGYIDHINRNKLDNRLCNLREVSQICNSRNTDNYKNNKSGVKGVHFYKKKNNWQVKIWVNKKQYHVGYYDDFDEAVCHRLAVEQCLNWPNCDSNSPAFKYVKENIL